MMANSLKQQMVSAVGTALVELASNKIGAITDQATREVVTAETIETPLTQTQVGAVVEKMVTQDPAISSKRVWATAIPVVSTLGYALLDPSLIGAFVGWLQVHPGAWWGVAANIVAVTLPIVSKALDKRPAR
jgi:hypothetical protein